MLIACFRISKSFAEWQEGVLLSTKNTWRT